MYPWIETALKFVAIPASLSGVWLGWWLKGRTDQSTKRSDLIRCVGEKYIALLQSQFQELQEGNRLHCLQRSGFLQLDASDHQKFASYVTNHGHPDPLALTEWDTFLDLPTLLRLASERQVDLRDGFAVYQMIKSEYLAGSKELKP